MRIYLLPMLPFEERYTGQWIEWWPRDLIFAGCEVHSIHGVCGKGERKRGEIADKVEIWNWRAEQLKNLTGLFKSGQIRDGDVFLVLEGWNPLVSVLAFLREQMPYRTYLVLYVHAGTYDPWDYLRPLQPWAQHLERGWFQSADLILVGSDFHRQLLIERRGVPEEKISTIGLPIHRNDLPVKSLPWNEKKHRVIFPHRLTASKAAWEFENIRRIFSSKFGSELTEKIEWIRTQDEITAGNSAEAKKEYYRLLSESKVVVSTARQETFGIAMQEGIALGAWAIAPRRLSYPEVIRSGSGFLYDDLNHAAELIKKSLELDRSPEWDGHHEEAVYRAASEIRGRFEEA